MPVGAQRFLLEARQCREKLGGILAGASRLDVNAGVSQPGGSQHQAGSLDPMGAFAHQREISRCGSVAHPGGVAIVDAPQP